ncbi:MAG: hypothetical protein EOO29_24180, partial [Comamonadaceae bacterium]
MSARTDAAALAQRRAHPRNGVYLAGHGLLSCLGSGTTQALQALREPPVAAPLSDVSADHRWPLHRLEPVPGNWQQRLARAVRDAAAQTGLQPQTDTPLFIGSSSLDMGYEEEQARSRGAGFAGDLHSFSDAVAQALEWPGPVFCFSTACT